ncbi:MAG TPA: hypothetical protein PLG52_09900, partial [Anaerolineales bacterium]|nr:hypothetical protein [Anaerolineales bacterium]
MRKPQTPPFVFKNIYPWFRYILLFGRKLHQVLMDLQIAFSKRPASSPVLPDAYTAFNTSTVDSEIMLQRLEGEMPA